MDKKGKLSRKDLLMVKKYLDHFKAMKKDVKTELEVLDELEWLRINGFTYLVKEEVYGKTKKGKELFRILKSWGIYKKKKEGGG